MAGHKWNDDKCELCGDKDWYADAYCSNNPLYAEEYKEWLEEQRALEETSESAQAN